MCFSEDGHPGFSRNVANAPSLSLSRKGHTFIFGSHIDKPGDAQMKGAKIRETQVTETHGSIVLDCIKMRYRTTPRTRISRRPIPLTTATMKALNAQTTTRSANKHAKRDDEHALNSKIV